MKQDVKPTGGQEGEATAAKKWSATPPRARRPSLPSRRSGRRRGPARADDDPHLSQTTGATNHDKRTGAWSVAGVCVSWGVGWVCGASDTHRRRATPRLLLLIITWRSKRAAYCAAVRSLCLVASESPTSSLSTIPLVSSPRGSVARTRSKLSQRRRRGARPA